jgi:hypothetical protein
LAFFLAYPARPQSGQLAGRESGSFVGFITSVPNASEKCRISLASERFCIIFFNKVRVHTSILQRIPV